MNRLHYRLALVGMAVALPCLALMPSITLAATPQSNPATSGQALEISPLVLTLTANPGQIIKTQINIRDVAKNKLIVSGELNDFTAAGEDGTPKIIMDEDEANNPFSLRDWIDPLPALTLSSREIKTLPVTIRVPSNAAPGGHYGVIRFTATPPDLEETGVSLSASVGTLVLLKVNGDVKELLTTKEFSVNRNGKTGALFEAAPLEFVERLSNDGNIHEQPAGQVTVTDMFGKKIAALNVNLPPRNILPQSSRKFSQQLDSSVIGNKKLFGKYSATLSLTYGENKQKLTASTTFWVIPYRLIATLIVILIGGFFALRIFIKRYNRRIIRKAQQHKTSK